MNPNNEDDAPELLPARMLNEFVYCPRLFFLEWVEGEFRESEDTIRGRTIHKRVDSESGNFSPSGGEELIHARSVLLSGTECGLIAKMDILEAKGKRVTPVDYKKGAKPPIPEGAWLADRVQVCAQGLILRENGFECTSGVLYYAASKTRVAVAFTDELVSITRDFVLRARNVAKNGILPPPLVDSPKCPRCSLVGICLPDEINALTGETEGKTRRIVPSLDSSLPMYVQEQGAWISKDGEEAVVHNPDGSRTQARLIDVSQLSTYGNVQITPPLRHELCDRGIPILHFSFGGWFYGITHGLNHKNVLLRQKQFEYAGNPEKSLVLARSFINGKIRNCRTLLRRNHPEVSQATLGELSKSAEQALTAANAGELLGIEGYAARVYFGHFGEMLRRNRDSITEFNFEERNKRPPRDPVNALLSYTYSLMAKDFTVTLMGVGFDPYLGFFHAPRYGKPSLALDTMEEFRPLIADSVVITLINNEEIQFSDFVKRAGAVTVTSEARKKILRAYERRLDSTIRHPIFDYTISYRRIIEVQARLLSRYLSGELSEYPPFCTR